MADTNSKNGLRNSRTITELARHIDGLTLKASTIRQLFVAEITNARRELQQYLLNHLASRELNLKSEDVVWKKCFHSLVHANLEDLTLLKSHLIHGIGFYRTILKLICNEYGIKFDEGLISLRDGANKPGKKQLQRNLVYLGDICRYLREINTPKEWLVSSKYYYHGAVLCDPTSGLPYNQLGTLVGGSNFGLDAVYYYMRSARSEIPFDGAESNLLRLLAKERTGTDMAIQKCLNKLQDVVSSAWKSKATNLQTYIEEFLVLFSECTSFSPKVIENTYFDKTSLFRIVLVVTMLQDKTAKGEDSVILSAVNALVVNCFLLLTELVFKQIQNVNDESFSKNFAVDNQSESSSANNSKVDSRSSSPKRALSSLRRKKIKLVVEDVDTNFSSYGDEDSELSELEETVLSTIDALEIESDSGEESDSLPRSQEYSTDDENVETSQTTFFTENSNQNYTANISSTEMLRFVLQDTHMSTLKVFCDFMAQQVDCLKTCEKNNSNVFNSLQKLVNSLITFENQLVSEKTIPLDSRASVNTEWIQAQPINPDFALVGLNYFDFLVEKLDLSNGCVNDEESSVICIERVINFGLWLSNQCPSLVINKNNILFIATDSNRNSDTMPILSPRSSQEKKASIEPNAIVISQEKQEEAKRFAVEFLKSEVSQLEKEVKGGFQSAMPPFIVIDAEAYCSDLNLVIDLLNSKKFIIVVPQIVLAKLDELKKFMSSAREAIRWLEAEALKGARFLRFQKDHEKLTLEPFKYPLRKDKKAYDFFQLLESCNYIKSQALGNLHGFELVTLLTSSVYRYPDTIKAVAEGIGVKIEYIEDFAKNVKEQSKSTGDEKT